MGMDLAKLGARGDVREDDRTIDGPAS